MEFELFPDDLVRVLATQFLKFIGKNAAWNAGALTIRPRPDVDHRPRAHGPFHLSGEDPRPRIHWRYDRRG